ncbi:exosome non-catalytic core subunit rrp46 [Coemansia sp. RSA 1813]|nr:exosome non-catalytic core subunit rrp46 [Coemansia sp. RSA 1646]KAJ1772083.1 exosome non-catalytic core subunit rrp46 [Coemansia sp. RSA 1843]KAJ2090421.1 exosome non-catalytic core subunit rrp46 [Coemansia sp. RSA 986]KAJ2215387.1 exosome non-catalytic core subunit rrp46 [Coemansia sp. RSA 487]KAJ2569976.1 exosome non-catalytic core subunit rrp46 [Coemansia sp. RSA 1813]
MRPDRREDDQVRALHSVVGVLNRVDGSAQFSAGRTSVYSGVYGPVDVRVYDEKLDRTHVEVKYRADTGAAGTKDRWAESAIRQTFERIVMAQMHPRTMVQINVQVRENDGSVDAVAINAVALALIDAAVPLRDTVAAASCAVRGDGSTVVDPTLEEIEDARSVHTFAFASSDLAANLDASTTHPVYVDSRGEFSVDEYDRCYELCARAAQRVLAFMRTAIEDKAAKESQISSSK